MRNVSAAFIAASILAGCDGPLLFAELQVPEIRITLPSQAFPASDSGLPEDWCNPAAPAQSDPPCIAMTLDYDIGARVPVFTEENVTYDLRLTDVGIVLAASEVGKDLRGVKLVTIRVLDDPSIASSGFVIATYARPPGASTPTAIAVTGNANVGLGPYLDAGKLPVRVELVFDELTPAFDADVQAAFSLEAELDYGSYF